MTYFADISEFQTNVNLPVYREGHAWLAVRVSDGHHTDNLIRERLPILRSLNFACIIYYHFMRPSSHVSLETQLDTFANALGVVLDNETVAIDYEANNGLIPAAEDRDMLAHMFDFHLNRDTLIYQNYSENQIAPTDRMLWLARFSIAPPQVPYDIWQCSNGALFRGIGSVCDENYTLKTPQDIIIPYRSTQQPVWQSHPEDHLQTTFINVTTDSSGNGYKDVQAPQLFSVEINASNPESGVYPKPGMTASWCSVAGISRVVVTGAPALSSIGVWVTAPLPGA